MDCYLSGTPTKSTDSGRVLIKKGAFRQKVNGIDTEGLLHPFQ